MAEDQQIELEGTTTNGNSRQPRNRNDLEMRMLNKSIWNCCPICAKAQNSESQKHKGISQSYDALCVMTLTLYLIYISKKNKYLYLITHRGISNKF